MSARSSKRSQPSSRPGQGAVRRRRRRAGVGGSWLPFLLPFALLAFLLFLLSILLRKLGIPQRATSVFIRALATLLGYPPLYVAFQDLWEAVRRWRAWSWLGAGIELCLRTLQRFASVLRLALVAAGYELVAWVGEWTPWQCLAGVATAGALALLHLVRRLAGSAGARVALRRRLWALAWPRRSAGPACARANAGAPEGSHARALARAPARADAGRHVDASAGRRGLRIGRLGAVAAAVSVLAASVVWVGCARWEPWQTLATLLVLANAILVVTIGVLLLPASNRRAVGARRS